VDNDPRLAAAIVDTAAEVLAKRLAVKNADGGQNDNDRQRTESIRKPSN
jgi:hypothetical protein